MKSVVYVFDFPIVDIDPVRKFILVNSASIVLNIISLLAAFIVTYSLLFKKISMVYIARSPKRYRVLFGLSGGILASITVLLSVLTITNIDDFHFIDALTIGLQTYFIFISLYGGGVVSGIITLTCITAMRWLVDPNVRMTEELSCMDMVAFAITWIGLRLDLERHWRWALISTTTILLQSGFFIMKGMDLGELLLYIGSMLFVAVVMYFIMHYVIQSLEMYVYFQRNAMQDFLTKLDNLRSLHLKITRLVKRMKDTNRDYTVMIADIDYFKSINDTYGHAAGDEVLRQFSKLLSEYCPKKDILARMGGEEFCLILSSGIEDSEKLANHIREAVAGHLFSLPTQQSAFITVSFGLAGCNRDRVHTVNDMHEVMADADRALYAAKTAGRNRVSVYQAGDSAGHFRRSGWN
ncbi:GGDEF domain-containing protein [Paenibacillus terrigena]|uniref:GGDEF domain-containing protein n=1 Tax=Paenibacillus terrigena TaxID=369333 RepID=UPI0028D012F9|nr:GGDEF domain-containing protein [Paenibacillus terrigena]